MKSLQMGQVIFGSDLGVVSESPITHYTSMERLYVIYIPISMIGGRFMGSKCRWKIYHTIPYMDATYGSDVLGGRIFFVFAPIFVWWKITEHLIFEFKMRTPPFALVKMYIYMKHLPG